MFEIMSYIKERRTIELNLKYKTSRVPLICNIILFHINNITPSILYVKLFIYNKKKKTY